MVNGRLVLEKGKAASDTNQDNSQHTEEGISLSTISVDKDTGSSSDSNSHLEEVSHKTSPSPGSEASFATVPPLSPPRSPQQQQQQYNTPQMMVLGKDGSDYQDLMVSAAQRAKDGLMTGTAGSTTSSNNNSISDLEKQQALLNDQEKAEKFADEHASMDDGGKSNKSSSSWWKSLWHGQDQDDNKHSIGGHRRPPQQLTVSDDDVESPVYYQNISTPEQKLDSLRPAAAPLQESLSAISANIHNSLLRNRPLPTTKEDQIEQDCSFLYRPVEDDKQQQSPKRNNASNNRLRAVLETPPQGMSTLYRDAQDVLSPPAVAQYQAKYQQLNQEYILPDDHDRFADYNDYAVIPPSQAQQQRQRQQSLPHDLTLEEQQQDQQPSPGHHRQHSHVTSVTSQSSLFHEVNGRVVLRLPRDHVRLLVNNNNNDSNNDWGLEPGILSVIQCRRPHDPPSQQLEYCLTVPSNLYKQVVSDMARAASRSDLRRREEGEEGLDLSFIASDHADIRIAIGIMVVILIILGINTLVFGLD